MLVYQRVKGNTTYTKIRQLFDGILLCSEKKKNGKRLTRHRASENAIDSKRYEKKTKPHIAIRENDGWKTVLLKRSITSEHVDFPACTP